MSFSVAGMSRDDAYGAGRVKLWKLTTSWVSVMITDGDLEVPALQLEGRGWIG